MRKFDDGGRSAIHADNGMVATSHPISSAVAINILMQGGNAVDAAIAAVAVQGVVEPQMTGIGGDCFAMIAEPDGSVHALDGCGSAPQGAELGWYLENGFTDIPAHSPHAVTVPGAVRAWADLHERFGTMEWSKLLKPAEKLARKGYRVTPRVAADWQQLAEDLRQTGAESLLVQGQPYGIGDLHVQPELADTLAAIRQSGADAFYQGRIAQDMASTISSLGGFLEEADLATHQSQWVEPIRTRYADHDVLEMPPSGQGMTALVLLNLFRELGNKDLALGSAERWHQDLEAGRLAYTVRDAYLADPRDMKEPVEHLISEEYARDLAQSFDASRRNPDIVLPPAVGSDTVYLTVVDKDRRCVSLINSTFTGFGSMIVTPQTGINFQSRGACFRVKENHPNAIGPGKKPLHTIIPALVMKNDRPTHSFGVMGGAYQPMGHAHVLSLMLDHGLDPQMAIDFPRAFWNDAGETMLEGQIPEKILTQLTQMGHRTVSPPEAIGGAQIVEIAEDGHLIGGSDSRKDGLAIGY